MMKGPDPDFDLIGVTYHKSYGTATYIRSSIENDALQTIFSSNDIHEVTIQIGVIVVTIINKPTAILWPKYVNQRFSHPAIYVGDFNIHHTNW